MTSPDPPFPNGSGSTPALVPDVVAVDHHFDADGLYALRAEIAAHADHLGAGSDEIEDLVIVGSELASNAIRHGGGTGRLRLWRQGKVLYCQVSDTGPGMADPDAGRAAPDPSAVGGRGLWISRQLCDELLVTTGPGGTTVTAAVMLRAS